MNEHRVIGEGAPAQSVADCHRACILVIGMHRSGTSAFNRGMSLLGVAFPREELASSWDDSRKLDLDCMGEARPAARRHELMRLIEEQYAPATLVVLKDPRICRFVPLYCEVLAGLGLGPRYVMRLHNPLIVIASLSARDGMTDGFASPSWRRHVLEAEAESRRWPRSIVSSDRNPHARPSSLSSALIDKEALLTDWRRVVRRIVARLGLAWAQPPEEAGSEIAAFLSAEDQLYASSIHQLAAHANLAEWVKTVCAALLRTKQVPDEETALPSSTKSGRNSTPRPMMLAKRQSLNSISGQRSEDLQFASIKKLLQPGMLTLAISGRRSLSETVSWRRCGRLGRRSRESLNWRPQLGRLQGVSTATRQLQNLTAARG